LKEYTKEHFLKLFNNELSTDEARSMLIDMNHRGETINEIFYGASIMLEKSLKLNISHELKNKLVDNCGTGGDKSNSFNISSTVSILCSSIGLYVAKHGNRSITSKSGSADVLESLGFNINLSIDNQVKMLEDERFTFIFAQNHHNVMKHIMPIRKSIQHSTIFNILGPQTNPARVTKQLIGVYDKLYLSKISNALKLLGKKEAMIVSSKDGMDEISISDVSYFSHLKNNNITEGEIDPQKFGFKLYNKKELIGGDAKYNANIIYNILNNTLTGAKKDIVLLNGAYLLLIDGMIDNINDGIELLDSHIKSKKAIKHLNSLIDISNKL
jgi:anthranilate phosphoribosyltransferase